MNLIIKIGQESVVNRLLKSGLNINMVDKNEKTPIHVAVESGNCFTKLGTYNTQKRLLWHLNKRIFLNRKTQNSWIAHSERNRYKCNGQKWCHSIAFRSPRRFSIIKNIHNKGALNKWIAFKVTMILQLYWSTMNQMWTQRTNMAKHHCIGRQRKVSILPQHKFT